MPGEIGSDNFVVGYPAGSRILHDGPGLMLQSPDVRRTGAVRHLQPGWFVIPEFYTKLTDGQNHRLAPLPAELRLRAARAAAACCD
jgi:hypothetical protein